MGCALECAALLLRGLVSGHAAGHDAYVSSSHFVIVFRLRPAKNIMVHRYRSIFIRRKVADVARFAQAE